MGITIIVQTTPKNQNFLRGGSLILNYVIKYFSYLNNILYSAFDQPESFKMCEGRGFRSETPCRYDLHMLKRNLILKYVIMKEINFWQLI